MDCLHLQYTHHDHHQLECTKMFHVQMDSLFRLSRIFREISILWLWIASDQKVFLFWRISVRIENYSFDELNFFALNYKKWMKFLTIVTPQPLTMATPKSFGSCVGRVTGPIMFCTNTISEEVLNMAILLARFFSLNSGCLKIWNTFVIWPSSVKNRVP